MVRNSFSRAASPLELPDALARAPRSRRRAGLLWRGLFVLIALAASVLGARAQDIPASCGDKWRIASDDLFALGGSNHYRLLRNVQVECDDVQLYADQAEIFSDLDRVRATGNVLFVSGTSRISADR